MVNVIFENFSLQQIGIYQYGLIETKQIIFSDEVRSLCEANVCRKYATTWACPPAVGTVDECREKCLEYDMALVFNAKYDLEDSLRLFPSVEGFGIMVDMLAKAANIKYINGKNTVTY